LDELSKSVITSSLNPIMAWVIPFVFGGLIFVVKSPFSAIERAKDEYIKIITAYIAVGRIPSRDDLIDLKHMLARKHYISANDLPKMQTVLDSSYCAYWASEKIDMNKKIPFNNYFSSHKAVFLKNDSVIPKTLKDLFRKAYVEAIINIFVVAGLTFILSLFIMISDPKATPLSYFLENTWSLFWLSALGQIFIFSLQKIFNYFRSLKK